MATTPKKSAPRTTKSTSKAAPVTKKIVAKSSVAAPRKKNATKKASAEQMRSFRPCDDKSNFFTAKPSIQSVYWLIIGVAVLILVSWTMALTIQIQQIYDAIELSDATTMMMK